MKALQEDATPLSPHSAKSAHMQFSLTPEKRKDNAINQALISQWSETIHEAQIWISLVLQLQVSNGNGDNITILNYIWTC